MGNSILVIETRRETREALVAFLRKEDYEVASARNAEEAVKRLREIEPCLILLDYAIPPADARRFQEAQRRHPRWASLAVILLAEDDRRSFASRATDAVAIVKPADYETLRPLVARHLRARRRRGLRRPAATRAAAMTSAMLPAATERARTAPAEETLPVPGRRRVNAADRARWRWQAHAAACAARKASLRAQMILRRTHTLLRYSGWVLDEWSQRVGATADAPAL